MALEIFEKEEKDKLLSLPIEDLKLAKISTRSNIFFKSIKVNLKFWFIPLGSED